MEITEEDFIVAEIRVPELAESITEGTIAQWLKQPGDYVEKGEYIVELETDKVNVEVISEEAGTIKELQAAEGDTVEVLATNKLDDVFDASPVAVGKQLFLRGEKFLYCIEAK